METIKIKYLRAVGEVYQAEGGDWIDLRCAERTELKAGEYKQIPLGITMHLPEGYEALVVPRSSTFRRYGILLANSIGIIDEAYCGNNDEWMFPAYATRDTTIEKNDRICQFRILKHQPAIAFIETADLGEPSRGGLGSTGRK